MLAPLFIHFEHFKNSWAATALCQNVVYEICIVNTHMQIKYFGYNMLTLVLVMSISCSYYLGELKSYCSILNLVDSFDTTVRLIQMFLHELRTYLQLYISVVKIAIPGKLSCQFGFTVISIYNFLTVIKATINLVKLSHDMSLCVTSRRITGPGDKCIIGPLTQ